MALITEQDIDDTEPADDEPHIHEADGEAGEVEDEVEEEVEDAFETATLRRRIEEPTFRLSQVAVATLTTYYLTTLLPYHLTTLPPYHLTTLPPYSPCEAR